MKLRLLHIIAVFPLVVFITCAVVWICSLWFAYRVEFHHFSRNGEWNTSAYYVIQFHHPGFGVCVGVEEAREKYPQLGPPARMRWEAYRSGRLGDGSWREWWIDCWHHSSRQADARRDARMLQLPYWPLLLMASPFAGASVARTIRNRRRRHRESRGLCLFCGYDLRASPDRCPECGQPNPTSKDPRQLTKNEEQKPS